MKRIIFLLIIFGCLLFCGCGTAADIEYGIDYENTAYMRISATVNTSGLEGEVKHEALLSLQNVGKYYRDELGFEYDCDYFAEDPDEAYIILTKSVPAESFEEAFDNLREMLCDEGLSVFSEVSCELSDTALNHAYRINGRVDLHRVFENTRDSGISKGIWSYTEEQLEGFEPTVTLTLPENAETYRLSITEPTEISHEGEVFTLAGKPLDPLARMLGEEYFPIVICGFGISVVVCLAGIITGIKLIKKGRAAPGQTAL